MRAISARLQNRTTNAGIAGRVGMVELKTWFMASTNKKEKMKTIKVYIEGGVCTDVVIPEEFHNKLNYEVIDYDEIDAEEDEKNKH